MPLPKEQHSKYNMARPSCIRLARHRFCPARFFALKAAMTGSRFSDSVRASMAFKNAGDRNLARK